MSSDDTGSDDQAMAELLDEESRGEDETIIETEPDDGMVHGQLAAPDQLGSDNVAELVASEYPADGPLSPEEAALHIEDH